jgi:hypothetical protein
MKKGVLTALVVVLALAVTVAVVWANGDGLVSYWPLDGTASDAVNGNDGTPIGDPSYTNIDKAPVIGNEYALHVDGNDHVHVPNNANLNMLTGSWGLWLKFDMKPSEATHHMNPLAKTEQYWVHASLPSLDTTLRNAIQAKINVGGTRHVATTPAEFIQTGVWYHVIGTYDGETLKLYVDGQLVDLNEDPSGPLNTSSVPLAIGTWSSPNTDYFHGLIDEVGIWNRVLSADEVAALSGWVEWLPPIALDDWTLNENATLPIKFQLYDLQGNLLNTDLSPVLTVTKEGGSSVDPPLAFIAGDPENPYHYQANYRPAEIGNYTAAVTIGGMTVGETGFSVTEPPVANGRGKKN